MEHARITELTQQLSDLKHQLDEAMTVKARMLDDKHDDDPLNRRGTFAPNPENGRVLAEVCDAVRQNTDHAAAAVSDKCASYSRDASTMTVMELQRAFNEICKEVREYCDMDIDNNHRPECKICQTHPAMITMGGRRRRSRKSIRRMNRRTRKCLGTFKRHTHSRHRRRPSTLKRQSQSRLKKRTHRQ
jgi:hypothetical protein